MNTIITMQTADAIAKSSITELWVIPMFNDPTTMTMYHAPSNAANEIMFQGDDTWVAIDWYAGIGEAMRKLLFNTCLDAANDPNDPQFTERAGDILRQILADETRVQRDLDMMLDTIKLHSHKVIAALDAGLDVGSALRG